MTKKEFYTSYCKLEENNFPELLYNFLMSDDNGFEIKYRKKESVCATLDNKFRYDTDSGYNPFGVEERAPIAEQILDFTNLIKVLHAFYFLNEEIGNNYNMKFELLKNGIFKISNVIKRELFTIEKENEIRYKRGKRKHDLVSTQMEYNPDYSPYFNNYKVVPKGGYSWNRYIEPKYVTHNKKIKKLKGVMWFPKVEEEVRKLVNLIVKVFDANMYSDDGYSFGRLNSRRLESKALFIAFLSYFKEGNIKCKNMLNIGITEGMINRLNYYIARKLNLVPNIDECVSNEINRFLNEEFNNLTHKQQNG